MVQSDNNETTYYNGSFRHGMDEKRRIQIPAKWRPTEPGIELTLVLWPQSSAGACLRVLPPAQMDKLMRDIGNIPNTDSNKVVLKRYIGSKSAQAPLDKVGRICVPEEMAKAAGITGEVVLVGLLDRFEIWSPERYQKVETTDEALAPEAFKIME